MSALTLQLIKEGTGGGGGRAGATAGRLTALAPVSFVIAGALTGATVAAAPPSVLDWTSSGMHRLEHAQAWGSRHAAPLMPEPVLNTAQILLESVKQETGLTWGQLADAMGVEVRTVHLWRNGGGISAAHESRLHDLAFLVDNVRLHEPSEARGELVSARSGQSLLERFRGGSAAQELALAAPWRVDARDGLSRSVTALKTGEAVDEDLVFLLYADEAAVAAFADHAGTVLQDPARSRREWEAELDSQFGKVEQPLAVGSAPAISADAFDDVGELETVPLFALEDLGIALGVGAIASRPIADGER